MNHKKLKLLLLMGIVKNEASKKKIIIPISVFLISIGYLNKDKIKKYFIKEESLDSKETHKTLKLENLSVKPEIRELKIQMKNPKKALNLDRNIKINPVESKINTQIENKEDLSLKSDIEESKVQIKNLGKNNNILN